MASKKPSEISSEELEGRTTDSVYDFIYHDGRRIASFLAQFDTSGHLTQITQAAKVSREHRDTAVIDGQVGVPLAAKVEYTNTESAADTHGKDTQRIYDPMWANALTLLDRLDHAELVHRDLTKATIGQFVLASGSLSISDLQLTEKTWRLPTVKKMVAAGMPNKSQVPDIPKGMRNDPSLHRARKEALAAVDTASQSFDIFLDLITVLPHTVQARIIGTENVWCSLLREGMTFDVSDIILKHGTSVPGTWHVLGILDALPDGFSIADSPTVDWGSGEEMAAKMMSILSPLTRNFLGRPRTSFGVTPLLIFRQVAN